MVLDVDFMVIVNIGDDLWLVGLCIIFDFDMILYIFVGINDL